MAFFYVHGPTSGGRGLEKVSLAAKKCWDLQKVYGFTRSFALLRKVYVRGDWAVKLRTDPLQFGWLATNATLRLNNTLCVSARVSIIPLRLEECDGSEDQVFNASTSGAVAAPAC